MKWNRNWELNLIPYFARVIAAVGSLLEREQSFEFSMQLILNGIIVLISAAEYLVRCHVNRATHATTSNMKSQFITSLLCNRRCCCCSPWQANQGNVWERWETSSTRLRIFYRTFSDFRVPMGPFSFRSWKEGMQASIALPCEREKKKSSKHCYQSNGAENVNHHVHLTRICSTLTFTYLHHVIPHERMAFIEHGA